MDIAAAAHTDPPASTDEGSLSELVEAVERAVAASDAAQQQLKRAKAEIKSAEDKLAEHADEADALRDAQAALYGLGAGLWTRDGSRAFRMGRAIQAGRVWTNCYHLYPAHAAFGGYKQSGQRHQIGRAHV